MRALSLLLLVACQGDPGQGSSWTLASEVLSAPGHTGSGTFDVALATNGVVGGGLSAGSMDVFSLSRSANDHLSLGFGEWLVTDGPGPDLIVFENAFEISSGGRFMDPALVEVSPDGEQWVAFDHTAPAEWSKDPADWSGFAGLEPVVWESESGTDPFADDAGGDRFDLADLPDGFQEVRAIRISVPDAMIPADPVSNGPDIDGVVGRSLIRR